MLAPAWPAPTCVGWKTAKRFPPCLVSSRVSVHDAALSSAQPTGCASHGASLFLVWPRKSNQKEGHPCIRVWPLCDQTSLTPALLRGHVTKGRPCPFVTRSASMPRVPLRNACVRPPEGDSGPSWLKEQRLASLCSSMHAPTGDITLPLADGRVEPARRGTSGMDAARGLGVPAIKGQGWPLYAGPRSVGGRREVRKRSSRTRMKGRAFFCLLFFAPGGDPRAKKSEAPYKAQPVAPAGESATPDTSVRASIGGKRFAVFHPTFLPVQAQKSETPCEAQPVARAKESAAPDINLHATGGGKRCAVFHPTQASADQMPTAKVPRC